MLSKPPEKPDGSLPLDHPKYESFARLVAKGKSKAQAAAESGFSQKHCAAIGSRLAKRPGVAERIEYLKTGIADRIVENVAQIRDYAIESKQERCGVYGDIYRRLLRVIEERAADPEMQSVPGGSTGLICKQVKQSPGGQSITEYSVDVATLRELRAYSQQAAEELGQWKDDAALSADDQKAAFPEWLLQEWRERGSTTRSEASDGSIATGPNTRATQGLWVPGSRAH